MLVKLFNSIYDWFNYTSFVINLDGWIIRKNKNLPMYLFLILIGIFFVFAFLFNFSETIMFLGGGIIGCLATFLESRQENYYANQIKRSELFIRRLKNKYSPEDVENILKKIDKIKNDYKKQ